MLFHRSRASLADPGDALSEFKEIVPTARQLTNGNCANAASVLFSLTVTPTMEAALEKPVG
jgi:hypothetical protein